MKKRLLAGFMAVVVIITAILTDFPASFLYSVFAEDVTSQDTTEYISKHLNSRTAALVSCMGGAEVDEASYPVLTAEEEQL